MNARATVIDAAQVSQEADTTKDIGLALERLQQNSVSEALAIFADAFRNGIGLPAERVASVMIEVASALISAFEFDGQSPAAYHFLRTVGREAADVITGLLELANFPDGNEDPAELYGPIMLAYAGSLSAADRHDKAIDILARLLTKSPDRVALSHAMSVARRRKSALPDDQNGPLNALRLKTFVVNLDRQADKYDSFLGRNAGCGIDFERFSASDGSHMSDNDVMALHLVVPGARFTSGAIGCAASHRRIWQWVVEQGVPALVFEDDVTIRHDLNERLAALLPALGNWDYVTLGYNTNSVLDIEYAPGLKSMMGFLPQHLDEHGERVFQSSNGSVATFRLNACFGTPGYVVSPAGAKKLLRLCFPMDNRSFTVPLLGRALQVSGIDNMINVISPTIQAYACFVPLVVPRNHLATSTVQAGQIRAWG